MFGEKGGTAIGGRDGPFYGVDQLANVSRPFIGHEGIKEFRGKALRPNLISLADPGHVVHGQIFDILFPRGERRKFDGERAEAERERSERKVPSSTIFSRFLFVAARRRKLLTSSCFEPTGRKQCS